MQTPQKGVDDIQIIKTWQGNLSEQGIFKSEGAKIESNAVNVEFFPRQIIVKYNNDQQIEQVLKKTGGHVINDGKTAPPPKSIPRSEIREVKSDRYYLIEVNTPAVTDQQFKNALKNKNVSGEVKVNSQQAMNDFVLLSDLEQDKSLNAHFNYVMRAQSASMDSREQLKDPSQPLNSALRYYSARDHGGLNKPITGRPGFNVEEAWQNGYTGSGVQIAIIDTGFVIDDYEMTGYDPVTGGFDPGKWVYGYNFTAGEPNPYDTVTSTTGDPDPQGHAWHGYYVAETAAGANNNHYGTSGVAPDASVYLFRVGQGIAGALSFYDAGLAVDKAVSWGADVINMSFGFNSLGGAGLPNTSLGAKLTNSENQGLINIASAGNSNLEFGTIHWWTWLYPVPACWDPVIAVGAVDSSYTRMPYSNYGDGVHIYGPGESLVSAGPIKCTSYLTNKCGLSEQATFTMSGTSNAAPFVAGIAVLMKQAKPKITTSQVRSILRSTATNNSVGQKIVNTWAAVSAARNLP